MSKASLNGDCNCKFCFTFYYKIYLDLVEWNLPEEEEEGGPGGGGDLAQPAPGQPLLLAQGQGGGEELGGVVRVGGPLHPVPDVLHAGLQHQGPPGSHHLWRGATLRVMVLNQLRMM